MPNATDYHWPPMDKRRVMGKRLDRLDGIAKSTGAAKYNSDIKPEGMLFGALLTSPYAHAKVKSIDTSAAEKLAGVTAVRAIVKAGDELQWAGQEIAFLAATTEEIANDAVRLIKVDYEVMPHLVLEEDLSKVGNRAQACRRAIHGRYRKSFSGSRCDGGRYLWHSGSHALLPGAAWADHRNQGRSRGIFSIHAERVWHRERHRTRAQYPHRQCSRPHGLHGRRIRQQVSGGPLGFGIRRAFEIQRRQAGKAVPGSRDRAYHCRKSSLRFREGENGGQEGRDHYGMAVRDMVDGRNRRRQFERAVVPLRFHRCSQPANQSHGGFGQRGRRSCLARAQPSASLFHYVFGV